LGRAGGRYVALEPFQPAVAQKRPLTVTPSWVLALTVFGRPVALDGEYAREARPQDRRLGAAVFAAIEERLRRGEVAPHPIKPMQGGWQGVLDGVRTLRSHDVSGYKLVYSVL
jgi:hypothetical protein